MFAVIGAHPDDAELGAGGFLTRYGGIIVSMTNGENCARDSRVAKKEQEVAAEILGVPWIHLDNTELTVITQKLVGELDRIITENDVQGVITHAPGNSNQEHTLTSQAAYAASRRLGNLLYFEPIPPEWAEFHPMMYCDITDYQKKYQALDCYKSQMWRKGQSLLHTRMALDSYRGRQIGVERAECFQIVRWTL